MIAIANDRNKVMTTGLAGGHDYYYKRLPQRRQYIDQFSFIFTGIYHRIIIFNIHTVAPAILNDQSTAFQFLYTSTHLSFTNPCIISDVSHLNCVLTFSNTLKYLQIL